MVRRISGLLIGALALAAAMHYGLLHYRIARSAAFCDAAEALPKDELEQYANRCDRLLIEQDASDASPRFITDAKILAQFSLAGRVPYEIVVSRSSLGVKHIDGNWRYSTIVIWDEDWTETGEPIKVLKMTYGTYGWRNLHKRKIPRDQARSQPLF